MLSVLVLILLRLIACTAADSLDAALLSKPTGNAEIEFAWRGRDKGFFRWGNGGGLLFGVSGNSEVLDMLGWSGSSLKKLAEVDVAGSYGPVVPVIGDRYLVQMEGPGVSLRRAKTREMIQTFAYERGWYVGDAQLSRTGSFVVIALREDSAIRPRGFDWDRPRLQLGLLDVKREHVDWIATLRKPERHFETLRKVAVSDDGRFIAIAGWRNGVAVVSVSEKKLLWDLRPATEVMLSDAAFSPDGKVLYCGGGLGRVYAIESTTGRVITKWWANEAEQPLYGHRITAIEATNDGRLVAAGTGPEGLVFVATPEGKKVEVFRHGTTILTMSFSPDSSRLATVANGKVKIWRVAEK